MYGKQIWILHECRLCAGLFWNVSSMFLLSCSSQHIQMGEKSLGVVSGCMINTRASLVIMIIMIKTLKRATQDFFFFFFFCSYNIHDARLTMVYQILNSMAQVDFGRLHKTQEPKVRAPAKRNRRAHSHQLAQVQCRRNYRRHSFLPRTILDWNDSLPEAVPAWELAADPRISVRKKKMSAPKNKRSAQIRV